MNDLAFATSEACLDNDFDMPLLLEACSERGLSVQLQNWYDRTVDWSRYDAVILRSPWDYSERLDEFLLWCENVASKTTLLNPLRAVRWSIDKRYLADLASGGVPVVPTTFLSPGVDPTAALDKFITEHPSARDFVVKPSIGCYSKDVLRFHIAQKHDAITHINHIHGKSHDVMLQPYLASIDTFGETNLVYFLGEYSHAIRKGGLLAEDGTVNAPTYDFRSPRDADESERNVALSALDAAAAHLGLDRPLLYARVDLVRGEDGDPLLLELEIAEPSLSLPLVKNGAARFAAALGSVVMTGRKV